MGKPETIRAYLTAVEDQIRWKRARSAVSRELEQHLTDQRDAFLAEGRAETEAERLAVEEMGDPVAVGTELDRLHRPKSQWGLLAVTLTMALVGAVLRVVLTACGAQWFDNVDPELAGLSVVLGGACLLGAYFFDYSRLLYHAKSVYIGALILSLLSLWLSPMRNNTFYYVRYVVLLYPTVYAVWLYACRGKGWKGVFLAILGGIPLAVIPLMAPYMLGIFLLLPIGFILLLAAVRMDWFGVSKGRATALVAGVAGAGAALAAARVTLTDYGKARMLTALHPELDPLGTGYQGMAVRRVLTASQWLGEGHGDSVYVRPGYSFEMSVPEWNHDFFLTTIIYKLGWLPFLLLMLALAGLLLWLLRRCLRQRSQAGRLIALSVVAVLAMQMVLSVMLNMGYVLFSASLPLVVGNLHSVVDMALIGLALSVFRSDSIAWEDARGQTLVPRKNS